MKSTTIAVSSILTALGVVFSFYPGPVPIGPTKVFPFQSMINVVSGILLGPLVAPGVALAVGVIRIMLGTGTWFALPGGIPGAILVGLTYKLTKSYLSAFAEIPGTALIGAFLSAFLVAPLEGKSLTFYFFVAAFIPPAVVGSIIGFVVMIALKKRGVIGRLPL